jgi:uncharacterized membrane protein YozB (DUF420 family)
MMDEPGSGFLGTGASQLSDLSLLAYIFILIPLMLVGFFFARRKMFEPYHKLTMTLITLTNWGLIIFLMAVHYSRTATYTPNEPTLVLPTIHLAFGGVAQLLATYLVIRMWFEKQLPSWFKVKRIKRYMRTTLALWLITAALGIGIYVSWYIVGDPARMQAGEPVVTAEPVSTEEVSPVSTDEAEPQATEEAGEADVVETEEAEDIEPAETPESAP